MAGNRLEMGVNRASRLFFLLLIALLGALAQAQPNTPPKASLAIPSKPAKAGDKVTAAVTPEFAEGLHAYQNPPGEDYLIPVSVKATSKDVILVSCKYPKGGDAIVGGSTTPVKVYE